MNTYVLNIPSSLALNLGSSSLGESVADNAKRLQLDGFRNHDFHLLLVMTALVAIGVIMEGPEIVHETRNAWLQCKRRRVRHRSVAPWITLIGALGWLFVAVGVAGEGYWEVRVTHDDQAITSFDEQRLGDAEKSASDAIERASTNEKEAAQLRKDAEAEHLARVKIEESVAWRHLTDKQKKEIGEKLRPLTIGENASVWYVAGDPESEFFASDLAEALRMAHLATQPPNSITWKPRIPDSKYFNAPIEHMFTGVRVGSIGDSHSRTLADAIARELCALGFDTIRQDIPGSDKDSPTRLWIIVDPRPSGPQGEAKVQENAKAKTKGLHPSLQCANR